MTTYPEYDIEISYLQSFVYGNSPGATPPQATSFTIQQTNPSARWAFKQLAVENLNAASGGTTVAMYLNGLLIAPSTFLTPTPKGIGTVASGLPWIVLQASDQLVVEVQGASTGDQINVQGLYVEVAAS